MKMKIIIFRLFAFLGLLNSSSMAMAQSPILVDDDSTAPMPNGATWATAFADLQDAIDNASSSQEVWIARGEYRPVGGTPTRASTF